ncbi:MAG: phosphate signaling complex protein PhoU [Bacteroidetes bacterium]|nr:phosphate signaling complex protein PhoU [Bacteroidota bacterium]
MRLIESEIQQLKFKILDMAELVQFQLDNLEVALEKLDFDLARKVRKKEKKVDKYDTKIDKRCERIIALFQPVADDLRFVFSVLKINGYLEQIGDRIYSIAVRIPEIKEKHDEKLMEDLQLARMMQLTKNIVSEALVAFFEEDVERSKTIFGKDDEIDHIHEAAFDKLVRRIQKKPQRAADYLHLFLIVRNLEKIADFAVNIAEEAIFHQQGTPYKEQDEERNEEEGDGELRKGNS